MNQLYNIRNINEMTQTEFANILGVNLRTYQRYENELDDRTNKYDEIYKEILKYCSINEEHGIISIYKIKKIATPIFQKYNIDCCILFGSYARNEARGNSDIDFIVDTDITGLKFLNIIEELRISLCKKIDLIRLKDIKNDDPILKSIIREGIRII